MPLAPTAHPRAQITARNLTLSRGGSPIIQDLSLTLTEQSRTAIVGENGCGKSTLLSGLAGSLSPTSGSVNTHGRIGVAEQELSIAGDRTVGDEVALAIADSLTAVAALDRAAQELAADEPGAASRYEQALATATRLDAWDAQRRIDVALAALDAEAQRGRTLHELSVGQRYRVRLACLLGGDAQILLLDEPTNHLDAAALTFLATQLRGRAGGFAIVSHDRSLLREVASTFVDLDPSADGRPATYSGTLDEYQASKQSARARWEQEHTAQIASQAQLRAELDAAQTRLVSGWRPPKGTGKHQRATRAASLVGNVKRRQEALDNARVQAPQPPLRLALPARWTTPPGTLLVANGIALPPRLTSPVHLALSAGDRVLVRGANGAGKSTLLKMLSGCLAPAFGSVSQGHAARVLLLSQESNPAWRASNVTVHEAFRSRAELLVSRGELSDSRTVALSSLGLLDHAEHCRPVRALSAGQRRRLDLALALLSQPDVLLLDEPTNHLSMSLVDELIDAIKQVPAAVVVATHDRDMQRALHDWTELNLNWTASDPAHSAID